MHSHNLIFKIKKAGQTVPDLIETFMALEDRIDAVVDTIIDGTQVDMDLWLYVDDYKFFGQNAIARMRQLEPTDKFELVLSTNRFLFDWMGQNFTDIGGIRETWMEMPNQPGIFDGLKRLDAEQTFIPEQQTVRTTTPSWLVPVSAGLVTVLGLALLHHLRYRGA